MYVLSSHEECRISLKIFNFLRKQIQLQELKNLGMLERFNCVSSNTNTNKVSDHAAISGGAFKQAILIVFKNTNTNTNTNERLHGSRMNLQRKIHFLIFKKKKKTTFLTEFKNLQKKKYHKFTQLNRKDKSVFIKIQNFILPCGFRARDPFPKAPWACHCGQSDAQATESQIFIFFLWETRFVHLPLCFQTTSGCFLLSLKRNDIFYLSGVSLPHLPSLSL